MLVKQKALDSLIISTLNGILLVIGTLNSYCYGNYCTYYISKYQKDSGEPLFVLSSYSYGIQSIK